MKRVSDIMQREVATLSASDHLDLASDIMSLGRIRHLPVEQDGEVVGVISQRDLFRAGISSVLQFRPTAEREWLARIVVSEVMTAPVITIAPDQSIAQAARLMVDRKIGCIPVTVAGRLVGLLSESDLLSYLLLLEKPPDGSLA